MISATLGIFATAWLLGGWLFIAGIRRESFLGETGDALRRFDPAAILGLALFMAIWPAIFVGAHIGKLREGR